MLPLATASRCSGRCRPYCSSKKADLPQWAGPVEIYVIARRTAAVQDSFAVACERPPSHDRLHRRGIHIDFEGVKPILRQRGTPGSFSSVEDLGETGHLCGLLSAGRDGVQASPKLRRTDHPVWAISPGFATARDRHIGVRSSNTWTRLPDRFGV